MQRGGVLRSPPTYSASGVPRQPQRPGQAYQPQHSVNPHQPQQHRQPHTQPQARQPLHQSQQPRAQYGDGRHPVGSEYGSRRGLPHGRGDPGVYDSKYDYDGGMAMPAMASPSPPVDVNTDSAWTINYLELEEDSVVSFFTNIFHYEGTVIGDLLPQFTFFAAFSTAVYLFNNNTGYLAGPGPTAYNVFGACIGPGTVEPIASDAPLVCPRRCSPCVGASGLVCDADLLHMCCYSVSHRDTGGVPQQHLARTVQRGQEPLDDCKERTADRGWRHAVWRLQPARRRAV